MAAFLHSLTRFAKKHYRLILLMLLVLCTRLPYLLEGVIPFAFDHGKDSLAIMDMVANLSPAFIGPWTSIPGLYFGPGWYYLLAPAYLIGGFNPVAPVFVMVLLVLLQVYLVYKYFGKIPAIMIAGAPFWLMISTSAWNPFPMTLITIIILIVLKLVREQNRLTVLHALSLGLAASFGFHFSAAYAIFYPLAIGVMLLYLKPKLYLKNIIVGAIGFIIPFFPQLLFELKHNFVQTKAVIAYFSQGEPHTFSLDKVQSVTKTSFAELTNGFLPEFRILKSGWNVLLKQILLLSLLAITFLKVRNKKEIFRDLRYNVMLVFVFIIIPVVGFFFLHFNVWYVYAMMPVMMLLVAKLIEHSPKWFQITFAVLLILTPIVSYLHYIGEDKENLAASRAFLPVKQQAIKLIREKAGNEPFASYHYVPDVYDFSYQYLYLAQGFQGEQLPAEFSYKPNAPTYIVQKNDIVSNLNTIEESPSKIFYIVEKPENEDFLEAWWGDQQYGEIVEEIPVSDEVTVYEARP